MTCQKNGASFNTNLEFVDLLAFYWYKGECVGADPLQIADQALVKELQKKYKSDNT